MEGDKGGLYALIADFFQQLLGEMQSGGGGGGGADFPGIDGLVALLVGQLCLDVGGQGHFAQPLQYLQEDALVVEFHHPVAVLLHLTHGGSQLAVPEGYGVALPHFAPGLAQAFPLLVPQIPQQQHLYRAAGGTMPHQPGGQHPGVVEHQAVAGVQIVDNVIKMLVGNLAGFPVQHHQPGAVPLFQGSLGNQFFRQIIIKIMGFQFFLLRFQNTNSIVHFPGFCNRQIEFHLHRLVRRCFI